MRAAATLWGEHILTCHCLSAKEQQWQTIVARRALSSHFSRALHVLRDRHVDKWHIVLNFAANFEQTHLNRLFHSVLLHLILEMYLLELGPGLFWSLVTGAGFTVGYVRSILQKCILSANTVCLQIDALCFVLHGVPVPPRLRVSKTLLGNSQI